MSPTPCCLASSMESFPANVTMVASTLSLELPAQSFALKRVIYHLGAFLIYQELDALNLDLEHHFLPTVAMEQELDALDVDLEHRATVAMEQDTGLCRFL